MAFLVRSPGSCGEFIQGYAQGSSFMVTCPINRYAVASVDDKKEKLPVKACRAVKKTLEYLGEKEFPFYVHLDSAIPKGKGLASSTADISAVAQAVALQLGRKLSAEEIAHIALSIEPSDATFFEGIVQFDYRQGKLIRPMGLCPAMDILIYDCGGEVDTMAFNSRADLILLQKENEREIQKALTLLERGIAQQSIEDIGTAATISAFCNQKILYKKQLDAFYQVGKEAGGHGVVCAHSGTVLGLIVESGMDVTVIRQQIGKEIPQVSYLDRVSVTNRGMMIEIG